MKILFLEWASFGKEDIVRAFENLGHTVVPFSHPDYNERASKSFLSYMETLFDKERPDCVFSSNYFPLLSRACNPHQIPYLAWVYDCPQLLLFSTAVLFPCNHIFMFDRDTCRYFQAQGISTVSYMPLAAPVSRYDRTVPSSEIHRQCDTDLSFVGSLYNESHCLFERLSDVNAYTKGYLDAVMQAQLKISGYSFIEELLSPDILKELNRVAPYAPDFDGAEPVSYVYSRYFIDRKLTETERLRLLLILSESFRLSVYTHRRSPALPKARFHGAVDYVSAMPHVFKCSKINLNITLRSIHTGIPLRAFDIMGCHGFLMTNFQADFLDFFEPGTDFVYYEDEQDLVEKCRFYLTHDAARNKIAQSGYEKVKAHHTYEVRLKQILSSVFGG